MHLLGTQEEIMAAVVAKDPAAKADLAKARKLVPRGKQEVYPYQAAALHALAKPYNGKSILEIGTYYGYTAAVMAYACPDSEIVTLNPVDWEVEDARQNLAELENVKVCLAHSWEWLQHAPVVDDTFDLIFVDGDHKRIKQDLPWWDRINPGGLFLFHDYTPLGAPRHCPPVFDGLNEFAQTIGQDFDVLIVDDDRVGMAGFYKRE